MTNFIPIFPLGIVVYPGEQLNLHIFEPRYKQLISECRASGKPFGIPAVIGDKMQEFGSLLEVTEVVRVEENGKMNIRTRGMKVFRILEVVREIPDKLYSGAIVSYPDNFLQGNSAHMKAVVKSIRNLHGLLHVEKDFKKPDDQLSCYDLAHHIGLSLEEEYELLCLMDERQRLEYIRRYLTKALAMLSGMEQLKEKIRMNGHFKNLSGYNIQ